MLGYITYRLLTLLTIAKLFGPRAARIVMRGPYVTNNSDNKKNLIHAHFNVPKENTLGHQRALLTQLVKSRDIYLTGNVSQTKYQNLQLRI